MRRSPLHHVSRHLADHDPPSRAVPLPWMLPDGLRDVNNGIRRHSIRILQVWGKRVLVHSLGVVVVGCGDSTSGVFRAVACNVSLQFVRFAVLFVFCCLVASGERL